MKKNNLKILATTLSLITLLSACGSNKKIEDEPTRILLSFGDKVFSLDAKYYMRYSSGWAKYILSDGSYLYVNEMNLIQYDKNSMFGEIASKEAINIDSVKSEEELQNETVILVLVNNEIYKLKVEANMRYSSGFSRFTLDDGSNLYVNEKNIIYYNDNSKVMDQIEEHLEVKTLKAK